MHRVFALVAPALAVAMLMAIAACGPGPTATPIGTDGASQPLATEQATDPASPAASTITVPGQADTAWGRIWEGLPPSFPSIPGALPAEPGPDPVSGAFDLPAAAGDPATVAGTFVDALGAAGWTPTVDGPLEDGSFVVDAARGGTACVARVQATPLGGIVRLTVLYGADCPFA
jgi:hypothetical protein